MKLLIVFLTFQISLTHAFNQKLNDKVHSMEQELGGLLNDGMEKLTSKSGNFILARINLNQSKVDQATTFRLGKDVKDSLDELPGISVEVSDLSNSTENVDLSSKELTSFIKTVEIFVQTKHEEFKDNEQVSTLLHNITSQYLPGLNIENIHIKTSTVMAGNDKADDAANRGPASSAEEKPKGPGFFERIFEQNIILALLFALGAVFAFTLMKMLSKKLVNSFNGIESSIKDLANTTMSAASLASQQKDQTIEEKQKPDSGDVSTEELNYSLNSIEKFAKSDFDAFRDAFKLYIDLGQFDEAIILLNSSTKLVAEYPEILGEMNSKRFQTYLSSRMIEILESNDLQLELSSNILKTLKLAQTAPDAMYNAILKNNISRWELMQDVDFKQFDSAEIGKIMELSSPEAIAARICNNQLTVSQIGSGGKEQLNSQQAIALISKLASTEGRTGAQNNLQRQKMVQIAMELPLELERNFLSAMKLETSNYPANLDGTDIEFILGQVKLMSLPEVSNFLGCMNDEIRIEIINHLPEIMAQRVNSKGFKVTAAGRKIKRRIWQGLIHKRMGGQSGDPSQNNAA